ncbi:MAG: dTMP kinase, partial [Mollicutes bacterium]|nr:dTMP kinase [Mollicutes bacterium]
EGLKRIEKNKGREVNRLDLEKLEFHKKVRDNFRALAKKYSTRYVVIDASKSLNEVEDEVYKIIKETISK